MNEKENIKEYISPNQSTECLLMEAPLPLVRAVTHSGHARAQPVGQAVIVTARWIHYIQPESYSITLAGSPALISLAWLTQTS